MGAIDTNKDKMTGGEFLSGLKKGDRLMPVITLVISLNAEAWDGPLALHEMLSVGNKELLAFVPNYRLNLLAPNKIEDFGKFRTELSVLFVSAVTGDTRFIEMYKKSKGEVSDMSCVALDYLAEEYRTEGVSIGEDKATLNSIRNLMKNVKWTANQAMDALSIPQEERKRYTDKI